MSDTATTEEMPPEVKEELEKIATTTKKGFDLQARVKNRGLRKATITLYLDEELGPELGWAHDLGDAMGNVVARAREGVVGELDAAQAALELHLNNKDEYAKAPQGEREQRRLELVEKIKSLEDKRDELIAELTKTAIVISMRAVPPVMEKNTHRLARQTLELTEKGIPEDRQEEFKDAKLAHLMTVMFQSVTDNATGAVNTETTYEDAVALMEHLPPGQYDRLDMAMGRVQFTDAISRQIEGQEDFS